MQTLDSTGTVRFRACAHSTTSCGQSQGTKGVGLGEQFALRCVPGDAFLLMLAKSDLRSNRDEAIGTQHQHRGSGGVSLTYQVLAPFLELDVLQPCIVIRLPLHPSLENTACTGIVPQQLLRWGRHKLASEITIPIHNNSTTEFRPKFTRYGTSPGEGKAKYHTQ